ncbi:virulence factor [Rahnella sp. AA]|uniref:virulence factor SrfC family protein n=1 Tax=Rahnella sp. AA TaxID=2057180 RepID=UPI000C34EAA2|nr:virulence factor SrfC family protein [Rahnella sp. AA]PKE28581.1 virulence factor [Rahnella sp. AA]
MTTSTTALTSAPELTTNELQRQFAAVSGTIGDALGWVETTRNQAPRLDLEADRLNLQLKRCRDKAQRLSLACELPPALGFYGQSQAGKSYLICSLAAGNYGRLETRLGGVTLDYLTQINPGNRTARLATRFTRQSDVRDRAFPVRILLLNEADLARIVVRAFRPDSHYHVPDTQQITEHLNKLMMHRQPEPVEGFTSEQMMGLWDSMIRLDARRFRHLNAHFWPVAVKLAPYLNIDDRARLFSLLWGNAPALTTAYRHYAHTLQHLGGAESLLAPLSVLVDEAMQPADGIFSQSPAYDIEISVCPEFEGKSVAPVTLSLEELTMLASEVQIPLLSPPREALFEQIDLLDLPGYGLAEDDEGEDDITPLFRAKVSYLPERYTDRHEMNMLMVCTASDKREDVVAIGRTLEHWVKEMHGENTQVRSRRKPGLVWVLTPFDRRMTQAVHYDEAVQRHVGNPGDAWGALLAMDERGLQRMADYLVAEIRPEVRLNRLAELLDELRRELADNLLGRWYQAGEVADPAQKQRTVQTVIKALQTRTGVHGELLEKLLPGRDELHRIYHEHAGQPAESGEPDESGTESFGIGIDIDLFAEQQDAQIWQDKPDDGTAFARQVQRYWINHLRGLPENEPLIALLGVAKPTVELLMEELITASFRLNMGEALVRSLGGILPAGARDHEHHADRQVSRALTVLGDFVAWLGFEKQAEADRPESRINKGNKIFAKPQKNVASWKSSRRLTKLSATPTNTTAFYIYDWLVGLQESIMRNAGYAAGGEIPAVQRADLARLLQALEA